MAIFGNSNRGNNLYGKRKGNVLKKPVGHFVSGIRRGKPKNIVQVANPLRKSYMKEAVAAFSGLTTFELHYWANLGYMNQSGHVSVAIKTHWSRKQQSAAALLCLNMDGHLPVPALVAHFFSWPWVSIDSVSMSPFTLKIKCLLPTRYRIKNNNCRFCATV